MKNKFIIGFDLAEDDFSETEFLKLHSDGVIQRTTDPWEAKAMPTRDHAIQLAKSLNLKHFTIFEAYIEFL